MMAIVLLRCAVSRVLHFALPHFNSLYLWTLSLKQYCFVFSILQSPFSDSVKSFLIELRSWRVEELQFKYGAIFQFHFRHFLPKEKDGLRTIKFKDLIKCLSLECQHLICCSSWWINPIPNNYSRSFLSTIFETK